MNETSIEITFDTGQFEDNLNLLISEFPETARKMMRAVNREVIKQVKTAAAGRGYKMHDPKSWGDAGIQSNVFSFENDDYTGKVMIGRNAFQYRFIESGAYVKPKNKKYLRFKINDRFYRIKEFRYPAEPLLRPVADIIWQSSLASKIMDDTMQKQINKAFGK